MFLLLFLLLTSSSTRNHRLKQIPTGKNVYQNSLLTDSFFQFLVLPVFNNSENLLYYSIYTTDIAALLYQEVFIIPKQGYISYAIKIQEKFHLAYLRRDISNDYLLDALLVKHFTGVQFTPIFPIKPKE